MEKLYKNLKVIIAILALAVVLVGASTLYEQLAAGNLTQDVATEPAPDQEEVVYAPDFTAYDLEGNPHKLSDFRGKPVILNFWASWCGPCKSEMPDIQSFYETYGDDIHFLIVNLTDGSQETVESASSYITREGYTFPVYYDTDLSAAIAYNVMAVPVTYFINAQGVSVAWYQSAMSADILQQGVDLILTQD